MYKDEYYLWHLKNTRYIFDCFNWYFNTYNTKSVIDYGCGVGYVLECAYNNGMCEIKGFDVGGFEFAAEEIKQYIENKDITKPVETNKYDLVVSMETAEHLRKSEQYIKNLCNSGNEILFSAAHPGQTGTGHINCQTKEYWIEKFNKNGFVVDEEKTMAVVDAWKTLNAPEYLLQNLLIFKR
jgi:SAM-dependent methyltransferase